MFSQVKRVFTYKQVLYGLVFLLPTVTLAILTLVPGVFQPPLDGSMAEMHQPPGQSHLLGTDFYGRDILSRIAFGAQSSLLVGAGTAILSGLLGLCFGLIVGYYEKLDLIFSRVLDAWLAFPSYVLAMVVMATIGSNLVNLIIALTVSRVPRIVRVIRGSVYSIREESYVEAAQAIGVNDYRLMTRHIMPGAIAPWIVQVSITFAVAILGEAALSFIGLGIPPPFPSWGNMLAEARPFILDKPWLMLPGGAIFFSVLGINIIGDGLRDVLDPKLKR